MPLKTFNFIWMKKIVLWFVLLFAFGNGFAQFTSGTSGVLNIPSAEMQKDGTFFFGANYLPEQLTPVRFHYNTANYYFNITFLPFLEVAYRMTLLQSGFTNGTYTQQDRAFVLRLRLLKERKYWPAVVLVADDIYTHTDSEVTKSFSNMYGVASKTLKWNKNELVLTFGGAFDIWDKNQMNGVIGGVAFRPRKLPALKFMLDYDSRSVNIGASGLVAKRLQLYAFLNDCRYLTAGLAFFIPLY